MRIKSYFTNAISDAVQTARKEMGEDAMLMETRKTGPGSAHLGAYEVVFGLNGIEPASAPLARAVGASLGAGDMARLSAEMTQMRRQLEGIRMAMRSGLTAP